MTGRRWITGITLGAALFAAAVWIADVDPFRRLATAAPQDHRVIEPRITGGFAWAPLRRERSALSASDEKRVFLAAMTVLHSAPGTSRTARHAAAIAVLLDGDPRAAATRLVEITREDPADAKAWSDLAAARCEIATREGEPTLLVEALAAADAALRLQPRLAEALFNRAAILEHLGLRYFAHEAWRVASLADTGSAWADEARRRSDDLAPPVPFHELLERRYEQLASDPSAAHDLARTRPLECRLYGEKLILGRWADAMAADDPAAADRHLRIAREFGRELARNHREGMLQAAVAAIDRAGNDARQHLVRGQILFREGQTAFQADRNAAAQAIFANAAREFELAGSPVALLAKYFLAHTYHGLGNLAEARRQEQQLLRDAPADFPAYRAQLLWHLGLGYQSDGNWGKALAAFRESVAIFEKLGETYYATTVRELLAEVYDRIGDPASAWEQRVTAFRGIGQTPTLRLLQSLDSTARAALLNKQWDVAISILGLAGETAKHVDDPWVETELRLLQARAYAESSDAPAASMAIRLARAAASRIDDTGTRNDAEASLVATEAIVAATPDRAVALLTKAIEFHQTKGRRILLPEMFLHRARAHRSLGHVDRAAADVEAGITEIETHRESLPAGESRWGVFHAAEELFEEAVSLALAYGNPSRAFAYSERARARELLEALGSATPVFSFASLDPDVTIVDYFALPDRLVIFVVSRDRITASEERVDRTQLGRDIAQFSRAIQSNAGTWREMSRSLHQVLIRPVEREWSDDTTLIVVPTLALSAIPFAALIDDAGRFLVERNALVIAPSAAVYSHLAGRSRSIPRRLDHLLVVANPTANDGPGALGSAEREAVEVAAVYRQSMQLAREEATLEAFRHAAPDADVIHFATHGAIPAGPRGSGALLLADGRLDSSTIPTIDMPRTSAVVLAACDTARGPARAEGTISVARAFLASGVPQVAATLWQIDDRESAVFFPTLHRHLRASTSLAAALRESQIEAIGSKKSPAIWAAVQCYGSE